MDNKRTSANMTDIYPEPEEQQNVSFSTITVPATNNEGIALQSLDSIDPRSVEKGQEEPETTMRSKISSDVRRWSKSLDEGLRSKGNDIIVAIFKVEKLSWIEKHFNFYRIHAAYFITLGALGTIIIYMLPLATPSRKLGFVDAMYTSFSVLCGIGFQTIRSQDLTYFHTMVLWVLMNLGAPVLMSLFPLYVRRLYFYLCIKQNSEDVVNNPEEPPTSCAFLANNFKACNINHDEESYVLNSKAHLEHFDVNFNLNPSPARGGRAIQAKDMRDSHGQSNEGGDEQGSLRMFVDTREALRTLEYRALVAIARLVISFFIGVQVIGFVIGAFYLLWSPDDTKIVNGMAMNPTFYAFFTSTASFSNSGYYLTNDSMLPFQKSSFLLILYSILPLLGNTLYPAFLRLLVWIHYKVVDAKQKPVYEYLLQYPRRCFISLFPRSQTIWLVVAFIALTSIQLIFLYSLEWDKAFGGLNAIQKLVVGFYQAVNTRNAGGTVVNLYQLAPATLVLFMVMMYISAYPTFLSLHTSNSINNYDNTELEASPCSKGEATTLNKWHNVIVAHSRRLLARDTSYLVVAILALCLSENKSIGHDPLNFSIFNIIFEVISAYGNIGLSIGYHCELRLAMTLPCQEVPYSFSGTWTTTGKVILVVVMFCGRHRGLPDNIDSAIRLPTRPLMHPSQQTPRPTNDASLPPRTMASSNHSCNKDFLHT